METSLKTRIVHAWNAFNNRDPTPSYSQTIVYNSPTRHDRIRLSRGNERSIVNSIFNRIAMDGASVDIKHCLLDKEGRFEKELDSELNNRLSFSANKDQTARAFMQDVIMSMLEEGVMSIVPIDTDIDPKDGSFKIESWRTGKILDWKPDDVLISVYNDRTGRREDLWFPKNTVAIIENPLYSVVNEPNSTMQRLIRKLNLLDMTDEQTASGKLDLIIQLPYTVKSTTRQNQANERRKMIEDQLVGSKYGIAYIDGTEKITQLNRPVENNLMKQIEYLTSLAFSQIGMTQGILDGTADEQTMINYQARILEPIISTIVDECKRKFLTKTARSQRHTIKFFIDPFKLVPASKLAEISDSLTRNEILSSNEIRQIMGRKPSNDPKANQLINSNISQPNDDKQSSDNTNPDTPTEDSESVDKIIKKE